MRALVTGSHGTVGRALCDALVRAKWELVCWNRREVAIHDYAAMEGFVARVRPDAVFHLATASQPTDPDRADEERWRVDYEWTSELAWITRQLGIAFVYTSTVMVFRDELPGPYTIASVADAEQDYGRRKARAEARVLEQNPAAAVARLGWQIGRDFDGNQMLAWLARERSIRASVRWMPACSFLEDTAQGLLQLAGARAGLYQLDSNDRWSFFDIAHALRRRHGTDWTLEPTWERAYDQRMLDGRIAMARLHERLPELLEGRTL
jgi:dTDP-4-dehydrorhamnose reductase